MRKKGEVTKNRNSDRKERKTRGERYKKHERKVKREQPKEPSDKSQETKHPRRRAEPPPMDGVRNPLLTPGCQHSKIFGPLWPFGSLHWALLGLRVLGAGLAFHSLIFSYVYVFFLSRKARTSYAPPPPHCVTWKIINTHSTDFFLSFC